MVGCDDHALYCSGRGVLIGLGYSQGFWLIGLPTPEFFMIPPPAWILR